MSDLIQSHESAWKELQQLLYERTVSDLTNRIDAIRQGDVDVGVVTGQEARDIFKKHSHVNDNSQVDWKMSKHHQ